MSAVRSGRHHCPGAAATTEHRRSARPADLAAHDDQLNDIHQTALHLATAIRVHTHAAAHRLGLGSTDCQFLALLALHGPLTPGQLTACTNLTSGAVTGVVDRLERAGFVRREWHTTDRRSRIVVLLPIAGVRIGIEYTHWIHLLDAALRWRNPVELAVIANFLADLTSDKTAHQPTQPS